MSSLSAVAINPGNASITPTLKLTADDYKTVDQLKTAQYSVRPRIILNDPNLYTTATAIPKVDPSIIKERSDKFLHGGPYHDFRDDLIKNGYCVVPAALSKEKAKYYESKMYEWVKSFESTKDLDFNDRSTWLEKNLPGHAPNDVFALYASSHEKFMWDARQEQGVIDIFAKIWGSDKLLVSFDGFNFGLPNRADAPVSAPWPHVDQSPFKTGMHCVQGIINLSNATGDEDGSLVVYKGTTNLLEEFFATQTHKDDWSPKDFRHFTKAEIAWFLERGAEIIRVKLEPGDVILWDSRTIHYGGAAGPSSNQIRSVIYASYSPVEFASKESLQRKKELFHLKKGSTHWAHDNIVLRDQTPLTADYKPDPEDRSEPREQPEVTDKLLKLAGVIPYN